MRNLVEQHNILKDQLTESKMNVEELKLENISLQKRINEQTTVITELEKTIKQKEQNHSKLSQTLREEIELLTQEEEINDEEIERLKDKLNNYEEQEYHNPKSLINIMKVELIKNNLEKIELNQLEALIEGLK